MSQKSPDQMTLLVLKQTNQVLSAVTRAALPDNAKQKGDETDEQKVKNQAAELDVLVGPRLTVRDLLVKSFLFAAPPPDIAPAPTVLAIPTLIKDGIAFSPNDLAGITMDLEPRVLITPSLYSLDSKIKPQQGLDPAALVFNATVTNIKLELPSAAAEDTGFRIEIYVKGKSLPLQIVSGTIAKGATPPADKAVTKSIQLAPSTTYQFLTFVQGFQPVIYERPL
jgi:hypothetical protein